MKKIAVVCAPGVGDALIFQIASHQLEKNRFEATTFSNHLPGFGKWFEKARSSPQPEIAKIGEIFQGFDAIFLQHDNSSKAKEILALSLPVYCFYGSHVPSKHGPLRPGFDFVCNPNRNMVENVVSSLRELFQIDAGKENGLTLPPSVSHRKWTTRVATQPGSSGMEKNWPRDKFLELAKRLEEQGYEPVFLSVPAEKSLWNAPHLESLEDLASFIYESGFFIGNDSGPGHLASCLGIPHLIIAGNENQMRLWRPGWTPGSLALPPSWIPNWKKLRPRWKKLITVNQAINSLNRNVLNN